MSEKEMVVEEVANGINYLLETKKKHDTTKRLIQEAIDSIEELCGISEVLGFKQDGNIVDLHDYAVLIAKVLSENPGLKKELCKLTRKENCID